jgi:hypothetical protein
MTVTTAIAHTQSQMNVSGVLHTVFRPRFVLRAWVQQITASQGLLLPQRTLQRYSEML